FPRHRPRAVAAERLQPAPADRGGGTAPLRRAPRRPGLHEAAWLARRARRRGARAPRRWNGHPGVATGGLLVLRVRGALLATALWRWARRARRRPAEGRVRSRDADGRRGASLPR